MSMKTMELPGMSEAATKQVEMLGWGDDLLARAADWLVNEFGDELGEVLIARALGALFKRRSRAGRNPP